MNRVLKTFLLWLMMAALPVQGVAAVIKATCGPRHHDMPSVVMNVVEHHYHASNSASHHQEISSAVVDNEQPELAENSAKSEKVPKTSYCSACAACCVGAVAPPSDISFGAPFTKVETAALPHLVSFTGFISASLERPPKHFSA